MCLGQALGDDGVRRGVEGQSNMRARHLEIVVCVSGHAVPPIYYAIVPRVDRSLQHRARYFATQRIEEIAGAATGVAGRQYSLSVLSQDLFANVLGGA